MKYDKDETVIITADEFVTAAAELTARIHSAALKNASTDEQLATVLMVDEILLHFSADLKHKIFEKARIEIVKEDK